MALELVKIEDIVPYSKPIDRKAEREKHIGREMQECFDNAISRWTKQVIRPQKEIIRTSIMDAQADGKDVKVEDILQDLSAFDHAVSNKITNAYTECDIEKGDYIQSQINKAERDYFEEHGRWPDDVEYYYKHGKFPPGTRDVMRGVNLLSDEDDDTYESNPTAETKSLNVSDLFDLDDDTPSVVSKSESSDIKTESKETVGSIPIDPSMLL